MTQQQYDNWIAEIRGDENGSTDQAINLMSIPQQDAFVECQKKYVTAVREGQLQQANQLKQRMEEMKLKRAMKINIQQSQPTAHDPKTHLVSTKEYIAWAKAKRSNHES
ncbi:MAG: hypothetical protein ACLRFG_03685 [Clostridia bacterium]